MLHSPEWRNRGCFNENHVHIYSNSQPTIDSKLDGVNKMARVRIGQLTLHLVLSVLCIQSVGGQSALNARIVKTKQGTVKGVLVVPSNRELQPVEAFLGVPYASPPVGALRFMPPVSPLPWNGVRLMDKYGPACPQTLPDVGNEREALRFVICIQYTA